MWIDHTRRRCILCGFALLLAALLMTQYGFAGQGQYRSRILLDPDDSLGKGAAISIDQLEKVIDSIEEPYAHASAGRHLARYFVQQGDYDKAVAYYRAALAEGGLSAIANRQMQRELAQVYLQQKDYAAAVSTLTQVLGYDLLPAPDDYLLLARAHHLLSRYDLVVSTLDRMREQIDQLSSQQLRQALALYYRAGAWSQAEMLLAQLLTIEPDNGQFWHQMTAVLLQQSKQRAALDYLALARDKRVPFSEGDVLLLASLYAVNGDPHSAARLLSEAMDRQELARNAVHYRRLFEYWFLARERPRAMAALARAAALSADTELYLYLAQMQMEQLAWQAMHDTLLVACAEQLPDRYVSRANLLLGISQLKLGDRTGARRSLINATLIGGASQQAARWLRYMDAEPTTEDEARRIVGIC